jgi:hypothetical protein
MPLVGYSRLFSIFSFFCIQNSVGSNIPRAPPIRTFNVYSEQQRTNDLLQQATINQVQLDNDRPPEKVDEVARQRSNSK